MGNRKAQFWTAGLLLCILWTGGIARGEVPGKSARAEGSPCLSVLLSRNASLMECWNSFRQALQSLLGGNGRSGRTDSEDGPETPVPPPDGNPDNKGQEESQAGSDELTDDPDILP